MRRRSLRSSIGSDKTFSRSARTLDGRGLIDLARRHPPAVLHAIGTKMPAARIAKLEAALGDQFGELAIGLARHLQGIVDRLGTENVKRLVADMSPSAIRTIEKDLGTDRLLALLAKHDVEVIVKQHWLPAYDRDLARVGTNAHVTPAIEAELRDTLSYVLRHPEIDDAGLSSIIGDIAKANRTDRVLEVLAELNHARNVHQQGLTAPGSRILMNVDTKKHTQIDLGLGRTARF